MPRVFQASAKASVALVDRRRDDVSVAVCLTAVVCTHRDRVLAAAGTR